MGFFVFILIVVAIATWTRLSRVNDLVAELGRRLSEQEEEIRRLTARFRQLAAPKLGGVPASEGGPKLGGVPASEGGPVKPVAETARQTAAEKPAAASPQAAAPAPQPTPPAPAAPQPAPEPVTPTPPAPRVPPPVAAPPPQPALAVHSAFPPLPDPPRVIVRPAPPPRSPGEPPPEPPEPPPPPSGPRFELPAFDWEQFVGVRLFSAIAGIALVLAGVFFLRYSIEHGWLSPTVRVIIGVLTGITLLVVCERKAARKYPVTANALDAAAIAILFSTFFAAHALWNLIPAPVAFGLLALVTATAVMLSIRRESLFIAVLGLLGGFATPALLSTGENRPIGLFSYLFLLNIGLAWVAYRQRWPVLTAITLVLTTLYQWGWVLEFLDAGQLPLAAGIFVVFALIGFGSLILSSARASEGAREPFAKTALIAAGMPLLFAVYFAAVPGYRDNFWLLFGFLLLLDIGLFAIAIAGPQAASVDRPAAREPIVHAVSAMVTLLVFGVWLAVSYSSAAWPAILGITSVFALFYLFAPEIAARFNRSLNGLAEQAVYAGPILLYALVIVIRREPAADAPWAIFGTLLALLLVMAWRAVANNRGAIYFVAAFLVLAAEALWSGLYVRVERLDEAVVLYAIFALVYLAIPVVARRAGRPLEPEIGSGVVLLASLAMLLYLSGGSVAPEALWGFALLLAILNAALFVETAAVRIPALALAASGLSWILMAVWWLKAADSVGILPSLLVLVGLSLLMTGGYAWARAQATDTPGRDAGEYQPGFFMALAGHLFLFVIALQPALAIPPWPLFAALVLMTFALLASALAYANGALHAAAIMSAALVMIAFAAAAPQAPWPTVSLAGFVVIGSVAQMWILLARRAGFESSAAAAAVGALFLGVFGGMIADAQPGAPDFRLLVAFYLGALAFVLLLTARYSWKQVALAAAVVAGVAATIWQANHLAGGERWRESLWVAGLLFALFVVYPLVLGSRSKDDREPYIAAIVASGWVFFVARYALIRGGLESIIGVLPVVLGAIMALLLRQLLRIQPAGSRDLGRLALVAATSLAFVTVAIPLQLREQWITIGWALEGAALAWLFRRIPHRGLMYGSAALLVVVFVRLALNPDVFTYEPRGELRIFNWYLYTYLVAAGAMFLAAWWLSKTRDVLFEGLPRLGHVLSVAGTVLLFVLLNIEIADFYATGPDIMFRFGATIAQDLTYTIGWLVFGLGMLAAGILLGNRPARIASVVLIAGTTLKCFLYDLRSLEGLYRVAAFVGLAISLILVSLAIQKYVRATPEETA